MTPFAFRLEQRLDPPGAGESLLRVLSGLILALCLGTALLLLSGHDPLVAFRALARGAFGSRNALAGTLNKAVPIGLCALGIAFAYRAKLWNIGAEGQLYIGAAAAAGIGLNLPAGSPVWLAVPLVLLAGFVAGAAWAGIAGLLKARLGVNEILTTLMLNYVAILWVGYLVTGPWSDPMTFSFPYSPPIAAEARLAKLNGIHAGVLLLPVAALALWLIDHRLRVGYNLRLLGDAPRAALYAGVNERAATMLALAGTGALAGLAGAIEVAGATTRLQTGLSPGYGFMAIMVAWLAQGRPLAIVICALLYSGLLNGGFALQISGIPPAIGTILQAVLLLSVLSVLAIGSYRIRRVQRGGALS